ncbi:phosphatase PAP2 family protein [Liquorilactobacillus oeni]|uniref:Membrane-associated phospholipid phosphatase n=1 Tax=Liquorilactobacillus oeni DSM 19972 TaxID=1423777 RepID=A0A0R1M7M0_9LACO|nr:phosphatase PAP2 family protein [Liquorilactobacillus oeni]KRL04143.1 membrane-associated phospholipid phosphatase [Liquorilactobacillus oeni DSM 19972]
MDYKTKKKFFSVSAVICVVLLFIAAFGDLAISNTVINYNSIFGTIFQTFGEFPVYCIFVLCGEIAMAYALRHREELLFSSILFIGGLSLSLWQVKQYLNEIESYAISALNNIHSGRSMGLANSDAATAKLATGTAIILWLVVYAVFTILVQYWMSKKNNEQLNRYLIVAIFASLTVWFALEVNLTLKDVWGRVRPYELSSSQKDFTPWFHPNGINGHKSFPSGHTMAGTLCIVFSWFATQPQWHKRLWITGIIYGILLAISRVIIGAHFFSDVTFSFFLTAMIIFVMRELYERLLSDNLKM